MKFRTGNIVKLDSGSIIIISRVNEKNTEWVSFDSSNCSGITKNKTSMEDRPCFCIEHNDGEYDEYCEDCKGTGSYEIEVSGMDKAKLLGESVKSYILKSLTKNFNF